MPEPTTVRQPHACLVPFGYPGYPPELLERFLRESEDMLREIGIDAVPTPIVIELADAKKAQKVLRSSDFEFIIPLVLSWLEAPNVIETLKDYLSKPMLLWSHTMYREGSERVTLGPIPGVGVLRQTFEDMGLNFRFVYGMPDQKKVREEISLFAKAASTAYRLEHSRIGLLGYPSMGMYTAMVDPLVVREYLGPEIDQLDQYALVKRIEEMDEGRVSQLVLDAKENWSLSEKVTEQDLWVTLKMYLGLKDIVEEYAWDAMSIKCQYELSKYYHHTPCVPLSIMGNDIPASCEGDLPLICAQLAMYYLSGSGTTYCDIHTIDDNSMLMGACGYAPFGMAKGKPKVDKTELLYEGLANCTVYREGIVTIARFNNGRNGEFKMHIETGTAHEPPPFHEVGCLPYPGMEVVLDGSAQHFAQHMMSQHYALVYGDIRKELLELCRVLGVTPVVSEG